LLAGDQRTVLLNDEAKELYKLFYELQRTQGWWSELTGNPLAIFLAIVLSRESFTAWRDDNWFTGGDGGPADAFTEAGARWYWSWFKDSGVINQYGAAKTSADMEAMMFNWIAKALQSADNLSIKDIRKYGGDWHNDFIGIAEEIIMPSNSEWSRGTGLWYWGNASLWTEKGQQMLPSHNVYQFGKNDTFYILNADQTKVMGPYKCPQGQIPCK
jgi:hypothetical protein